MINVGIVGAGYWGKHLVRNFNANKSVGKLLVCDANKDILKKIARDYPNAELFDNIDTMLSQSCLDAVVIATPPEMHAEHATKALKNNLHTLVEKPLTTSIKDSLSLVELAEKNNLTLMVDHTFLYNNIVEEVKRIVQSGELGEIYYIYANRINLGIVRRDVSVIWNLAPHDISIANYVLGKLPITVTANSHCYVQKKLGIPDVVYINLKYDNDVSVNIHNSWLDPFKRRNMVIVGNKKMLFYDDIHSDRHIQIHDKKIDIDFSEINNFADYRAVVSSGEIRIPNIKLKEPLACVTDNFIQCLINGERPKACGRHALEVVSILEAIETSTQNNNVAVPIEYPIR